MKVVRGKEVKVRVLEKTEVKRYSNEHGPGKIVKLVMRPAIGCGPEFQAVMFNKVVDEYNKSFVVGESNCISNFTCRDNEIVIDLEPNPEDVVFFDVTSIRLYEKVIHMRISIKGENLPAVYFRNIFDDPIKFEEHKTYEWKKSGIKFTFANEQYFPNDLMEVVLDRAGFVKTLDKLDLKSEYEYSENEEPESCDESEYSIETDRTYTGETETESSEENESSEQVEADSESSDEELIIRRTKNTVKQFFLQ